MESLVQTATREGGPAIDLVVDPSAEIDDLPEEHEPGGGRMLYTRGGGAKAPYKVVDQKVLTPEQLEEFAAFVRSAARTMAGTQYPASVIDDPFMRAGAETRAIHLPGEVSGD